MDYKFSLPLIMLLKGVVYEHQKEVWENLLHYEAEIKKYYLPLGLELFLDKGEGYAFLSPKKEGEEETPLPKLSEKRQLNFFVTLLCVTIRKFLLEHDAQGGSVRSIINEQEIINRAKVFLPAVHDEAKQQEKIITAINKTAELGFLRKLDDKEKNYEVHRIIKGFVPAEAIDDTLKRLQNYAAEKQAAD